MDGLQGAADQALLTANIRHSHVVSRDGERREDVFVKGDPDRDAVAAGKGPVVIPPASSKPLSPEGKGQSRDENESSFG